MKKVLICLLFLIGIIIILFSTDYAYSLEKENEVEKDLTESVNEQLEKIDFSAFSEYLDKLSKEQQELFGSENFKEKVSNLLNGEYGEDGTFFLNAFFKGLLTNLLKFLPTLISIVVIAILSGLLSQMKSGFMSNSTEEIIHFVCYGVIIILVLSTVMGLVTLAKNTLNIMKGQMDIVFPIILTLITALGGVVSVKVYQPAVALLSNIIVNIITYVIFPIFVVTCVLTVVSNISKNVRLNKLNEFFLSLSKWILGVSFTVFVAFLSIQGITAGAYDGISIRAAKYAVSNSIPILGGYIKDGFDLIMASTVLIKNSVGVAGIMLLLTSILYPIINIVIFMFGLRLTSAIVQPISNERISTYLSDISKNINMLIVAIVGTAFMYFITTMLFITTSNVFI